MKPLLIIFLSLLVQSQLAWGANTQLGEALHEIPSGLSSYIRMVDNFFIFYDPSTSMDIPYKETGMSRIEAQKQIISRSNLTLPDLGWQTGLYPHWKGGLWLHGSPMAFKPFYRLQRYDQQSFGEAVEMLPVTPQGPPMLQRGLMKLEHLLGLPGRTEIFLFTDGGESTFEPMEKPPLEQARLLASQHDVCFTVISSARSQEEKRLVEELAAVNGCSQVIDFDTVFNNPEHLLGKLFLDTDKTKFTNVLFEFDRSDVGSQFFPVLDRLGTFLTDHPEAYVVLSGFTDNIGTEAYNIKLSQQRAEAVSRYLQKRYELQPNRILTYWYGYENPAASNSTRQGRQLNRRVTITLRGQ